jgi:hypothetical protein
MAPNDYGENPWFPRDREFILKRHCGPFRGYITGTFFRLDGSFWVFIEDRAGGFAIGRRDCVIPVKELPALQSSG